MISIGKDTQYLCTKDGSCPKEGIFYPCYNCKHSTKIGGFGRILSIALFWLIVLICVGTIIRGIVGSINYQMIKHCSESKDYVSVNCAILNAQVLGGGSFYRTKEGYVIVKYIRPTGVGNYVKHVTGAFDVKNDKFQVLYSGHVSKELWHRCYDHPIENTILVTLENPESKILYRH